MTSGGGTRRRERFVRAGGREWWGGWCRAGLKDVDNRVYKRESLLHTMSFLFRGPQTRHVRAPTVAVVGSGQPTFDDGALGPLSILQVGTGQKPLKDGDNSSPAHIEHEYKKFHAFFTHMGIDIPITDKKSLLSMITSVEANEVLRVACITFMFFTAHVFDVNAPDRGKLAELLKNPDDTLRQMSKDAHDMLVYKSDPTKSFDLKKLSHSIDVFKTAMRKCTTMLHKSHATDEELCKVYTSMLAFKEIVEIEEGHRGGIELRIQRWLNEGKKGDPNWGSDRQASPPVVHHQAGPSAQPKAVPAPVPAPKPATQPVQQLHRASSMASPFRPPTVHTPIDVDDTAFKLVYSVVYAILHSNPKLINDTTFMVKTEHAGSSTIPSFEYKFSESLTKVLWALNTFKIAKTPIERARMIFGAMSLYRMICNDKLKYPLPPGGISEDAMCSFTEGIENDNDIPDSIRKHFLFPNPAPPVVVIADEERENTHPASASTGVTAAPMPDHGEGGERHRYTNAEYVGMAMANSEVTDLLYQSYSSGQPKKDKLLNAVKPVVNRAIGQPGSSDDTVAKSVIYAYEKSEGYRSAIAAYQSANGSKPESSPSPIVMATKPTAQPPIGNGGHPSKTVEQYVDIAFNQQGVLAWLYLAYSNPDDTTKTIRALKETLPTYNGMHDLVSEPDTLSRVAKAVIARYKTTPAYVAASSEAVLRKKREQEPENLGPQKAARRTTASTPAKADPLSPTDMDAVKAFADEAIKNQNVLAWFSDRYRSLSRVESLSGLLTVLRAGNLTVNDRVYNDQNTAIQKGVADKLKTMYQNMQNYENDRLFYRTTHPKTNGTAARMDTSHHMFGAGQPTFLRGEYGALSILMLGTGQKPVHGATDDAIRNDATTKFIDFLKYMGLGSSSPTDTIKRFNGVEANAQLRVACTTFMFMLAHGMNHDGTPDSNSVKQALSSDKDTFGQLSTDSYNMLAYLGGSLKNNDETDRTAAMWADIQKFREVMVSVSEVMKQKLNAAECAKIYQSLIECGGIVTIVANLGTDAMVTKIVKWKGPPKSPDPPNWASMTPAGPENENIGIIKRMVSAANTGSDIAVINDFSNRMFDKLRDFPSFPNGTADAKQWMVLGAISYCKYKSLLNRARPIFTEIDIPVLLNEQRILEYATADKIEDMGLEAVRELIGIPGTPNYPPTHATSIPTHAAGGSSTEMALPSGKKANPPKAPALPFKVEAKGVYWDTAKAWFENNKTPGRPVNYHGLGIELDTLFENIPNYTKPFRDLEPSHRLAYMTNLRGKYAASIRPHVGAFVGPTGGAGDDDELAFDDEEYDVVDVDDETRGDDVNGDEDDEDEREVRDDHDDDDTHRLTGAGKLDMMTRAEGVDADYVLNVQLFMRYARAWVPSHGAMQDTDIPAAASVIKDHGEHVLIGLPNPYFLLYLFDNVVDCGVKELAMDAGENAAWLSEVEIRIPGKIKGYNNKTERFIVELSEPYLLDNYTHESDPGDLGDDYSGVKRWRLKCGEIDKARPAACLAKTFEFDFRKHKQVKRIDAFDDMVVALEKGVARSSPDVNGVDTFRTHDLDTFLSTYGIWVQRATACPVLTFIDTPKLLNPQDEREMVYPYKYQSTLRGAHALTTIMDASVDLDGIVDRHAPYTGKAVTPSVDCSYMCYVHKDNDDEEETEYVYSRYVPAHKTVSTMFEYDTEHVDDDVVFTADQQGKKLRSETLVGECVDGLSTMSKAAVFVADALHEDIVKLLSFTVKLKSGDAQYFTFHMLDDGNRQGGDADNARTILNGPVVVHRRTRGLQKSLIDMYVDLYVHEYDADAHDHNLTKLKEYLDNATPDGGYDKTDRQAERDSQAAARTENASRLASQETTKADINTPGGVSILTYTNGDPAINPDVTEPMLRAAIVKMLRAIDGLRGEPMDSDEFTGIDTMPPPVARARLQDAYDKRFYDKTADRASRTQQQAYRILKSILIAIDTDEFDELTTAVDDVSNGTYERGADDGSDDDGSSSEDDSDEDDDSDEEDDTSSESESAPKRRRDAANEGESAPKKHRAAFVGTHAQPDVEFLPLLGRAIAWLSAEADAIIALKPGSRIRDSTNDALDFHALCGNITAYIGRLTQYMALLEDVRAVNNRVPIVYYASKTADWGITVRAYIDGLIEAGKMAGPGPTFEGDTETIYVSLQTFDTRAEAILPAMKGMVNILYNTKDITPAGKPRPRKDKPTTAMVVQERYESMLKTELQDHQQANCDKFTACHDREEGFIIADEMGSGKTLSAIACAASLYSEGEDFQTIIVCPKAVMHVWKNEIMKHTKYTAPTIAVLDQGRVNTTVAALKNVVDYKCSWVIVSFEKMLSLYGERASGEYNKLLDNHRFTCIIVDEVHSSGALRRGPVFHALRAKYNEHDEEIVEHHGLIQRQLPMDGRAQFIGVVVLTGTPVRTVVQKDMSALCAIIPLSNTGGVDNTEYALESTWTAIVNADGSPALSFFTRMTKEQLLAVEDKRFNEIPANHNSGVHRKLWTPIIKYKVHVEITDEESDRFVHLLTTVQEQKKSALVYLTPLRLTTDVVPLSYMSDEANEKLRNFANRTIDLAGTKYYPKYPPAVSETPVDTVVTLHMLNDISKQRQQLESDDNKELDVNEEPDLDDKETIKARNKRIKDLKESKMAQLRAIRVLAAEESAIRGESSKFEAVVDIVNTLNTYARVAGADGVSTGGVDTLSRYKWNIKHDAHEPDHTLETHLDPWRRNEREALRGNDEREVLRGDSSAAIMPACFESEDALNARMIREKRPSCAEKRKILIFSNFNMTLEALAIYLQAKLKLDSLPDIIAQNTSNRVGECLARFRDDPRRQILLMQMKSGGVGLQIEFAHAVIFVDCHYCSVDHDQAIARAHRIGQTRDVRVFYLLPRHTDGTLPDGVVRNTLDAHIYEKTSTRSTANTGFINSLNNTVEQLADEGRDLSKKVAGSLLTDMYATWGIGENHTQSKPIPRPRQVTPVSSTQPAHGASSAQPPSAHPPREASSAHPPRGSPPAQASLVHLGPNTTAAELNALTNDELKNRCRNYGLTVGGNKEKLVHRLLAYLATV